MALNVVFSLIMCACGAGSSGSSLSIDVLKTEYDDYRSIIFNPMVAKKVTVTEYSEFDDQYIRVFADTLLNYMNINPGRDGVSVSIISIEYTNTNLPNYSLYIRKPGNNDLLVYNHGHGGLPYPNDLWAIDLLKNEMQHQDLLITCMPMVGFNRIDLRPNWNTGYYWFIPEGSNTKAQVFIRTHDFFKYMGDPVGGIHYFLDASMLPSMLTTDPNRPSPSNYFGSVDGGGYKNYNKVSISGISGGGWTSLLATPAYPFQRLVSVAGFLPKSIKASGCGDYEQCVPDFFDKYSYEKILDMINKSTTSATYVYNRYDSCCFYDPWASQFKDKFKNLDIVITELNLHSFVPEFISSLLTAD